MLPSAFVFLDALPLTRNGKLDRRALPAPDGEQGEQEGYVAPRTVVEAALAELWGDVLGRAPIGVYDNFFALGGHSLLATQLIVKVRERFQVHVSLRSLFEDPTVAGAARLIAERLRAHEADNDGPAARFEEPHEAALPAVVPDPDRRHEPFPLTDIQQAYWIGRGATFALGNIATHGYHEFDSIGLDLERLGEAWRRLIERHEMLRAVVLPDGRQRILPRVPPYQIATLDLRGQPPRTVAVQLEAVRRHMSHQVLPSDRWPLFEIRATRLDDQRVRLHISIDVLIADAWSFQIIARELARLYRDPAAQLPMIELSFRDYLLAANTLQDSELYRASLAYWRGRLPELPPAPDLPLAQNPAALAHPRFSRRSGRLDAQRWGRLKGIAAEASLTPSGVLLAAFAEVLAAWSKRPRFTINLTLFNRLPLHPQAGSIVGDFTSSILLAVGDARPASFEQRARCLQAQLWRDLDHRYVGGVQVLRELTRAQDAPNGVTMPVVFTSAIFPDAEDAEPEPLAILGELGYGIFQTPQVWLDHQVTEQAGALIFNWDAVDELFPASCLDDMFDTYRALLLRLAEDAASWRTNGAPLPPAQLARRREANATEAPLRAELLQTLFAAQVARRPGQAALIATGRTLTYAELDQRSNGIGRRLRELGARPDTLVAVVMEKGWEQTVAALGILKAGAAYLPIDPALPQERVWHLLDQGEAAVALTQPWIDGRLAWPAGVQRLCVDMAELAGADGCPLEPAQNALNLAYVIYTSGSTGLPKGVMIDHRGAVNTILDINERFAVGPGDRVLALSELGFDLSVYDIFGTLAAGGTIIVPDAAATREPAHWAELIEREGATIWNSVPALLELFAEYLAGHPERTPRTLRLALLSGDWIPLSLPDQFRALAPEVELVSLGGATEASIWSILYPIATIDPAWWSIPYGRPMANQQFHVLNAALEPCPEWVPGQLYIGGVGLARGYWHDPAKTAERFIPNQFAEVSDVGYRVLGDEPPDSRHPIPDTRLYKTGDLGRYLPDGTIEFLGREDQQVKVQGYRVELGEIEAALRSHPAVRAAVVALVGERQRDKRLVAYIVQGLGVGGQGSDERRMTNDERRTTIEDRGLKIEDSASQESTSLSSILYPLSSELRSFLVARLPAYMIPSAFIVLDALPLTPNGKVDRKALPAPASVRPEPSRPARAEQPGDIARIARVVAGVLQLAAIDPHANLLESGATSVDMMRIANALEQELQFRPRFDEFYRLPTVAGLALSYRQQNGVQPAGENGQPRPDGLLASFSPLRDPEQREQFKTAQPGVRRDLDDRPSIRLAGEADGGVPPRAYAERRSYRQFTQPAIPLARLARLLSCLDPISRNGQPKYLYPSAGGLYPVQTYVQVKSGRVEGLPGGVYYYHPLGRRLALLAEGVEPDGSVHDPFVNRPIFDQAAFSLFLIAQLGAIAPLYGDQSIHFATIEAGAISQLLMSRAPECAIGLCPIGSLDFERIRRLFELDEGHVLIHSLLGGGIEPSQAEEWAAFQERYVGTVAAPGEREEGEL